MAGRDTDNDIVEGIVLMRRGEKTVEVIKRIESEVESINNSGALPQGVQIKPYYDRRELIGGLLEQPTDARDCRAHPEARRFNFLENLVHLLQSGRLHKYQLLSCARVQRD